MSEADGQEPGEATPEEAPRPAAKVSTPAGGTAPLILDAHVRWQGEGASEGDPTMSDSEFARDALPPTRETMLAADVDVALSFDDFGALDLDFSDLPDLPPPSAQAPQLPAFEEGPGWEELLTEEFRRKDVNSDGVLSMKEIKIKELLRLDVDHNGKISFDEYKTAFLADGQASFKRQDVDRDQRLTLEEYAGPLPNPRQFMRFYTCTEDRAGGMTLEEYMMSLCRDRLGML